MPLTRDQYVLLAAYELSKIKEKITIEELTVKSWEMNRQDFGLSGYKMKHPNSNAIYVLLMNKNGAIRKNGWLEKVGEKIYSLTTVGINEALSISKKNKDLNLNIKEQNIDDSNRIEEGKIKIFLSSSTVEDILKGEQEFIFLNACVFWGIPELPNARQLANGLANTELLLQIIKNKIIKSGKHYNIPKKYSISLSNINLLIQTHENFKKIFSEKIEKINKLTDERKH